MGEMMLVSRRVGMRVVAGMILVVGLVARGSVQEPSDAATGDEKKEAVFAGLTLRGIGPALMSGRVNDIAVDPVKPSTWYVAAASGGVWKTTNSGTTWTPIFDGSGIYSIGCVAVDPSNHLVVWVGTGENNSQRSVGYGDGLYKSIDGGATFTKVGLESSEHIAKVLIDPRDSKVVYVAAQGPLWNPGGDRGLYKTTDGGKTWKAVLTISDNTGVTDVVFDPRNPDVLYAAAYQRRRHVWTLIDGGPESGLYRSSDAGADLAEDQQGTARRATRDGSAWPSRRSIPTSFTRRSRQHGARAASSAPRTAARAGPNGRATSPPARNTTSEIVADPRVLRPGLLDGHPAARHRGRRQDVPAAGRALEARRQPRALDRPA